MELGLLWLIVKEPPPLLVISIGGPMCVGSFAVWLLGSPPPETVALLVTFAWMFWGAVTVNVMAG
jgi:hypothetical protein